MDIDERIDYCTACGEYTHGKLRKKPMTIIINNKTVNYIGMTLTCSECGERMYTKETLDYNIKESNEAYKRLTEIEKEKEKTNEEENEKEKYTGKIYVDDSKLQRFLGKFRKGPVIRVVNDIDEYKKKKERRKKLFLIGGIGVTISTAIAVIRKIIKKKK